MAFVERCTEMARLRELFAQTEQGKAQTVVISGAVASGKTELLHTFAEETARSGALVLTATGARAESGLALGVICQLVHNGDLPPDLVQQADSLLNQSIQHPEDPEREPVTLQQTSAKVARGLSTMLLELAAERSVVLVIDDIQYADGPSLQFLLYLMRRLTNGRLMVVLSECAVAHPSHPTFHAELLRQRNCHRVRLHLLSPQGVRELLAELTDEDTAGRLAPVYHQVSGGNPLLLRGLVEDGMVRLAGGTEALSTRPITEESFQQAVLACLYRWDSTTIRVAHGLAVLGRWATPPLVAALVDVKAARVEQSVADLARSGFLTDGRLRHPAVTATVLGTIGLEERTRMHGRAAELLHDNGVRETDVAEHLVAAGRIRGQDDVSVLRNAAVQSLAEDHVDFAVECLTLACAGCTDERQRAALTLTLTRLEWRTRPSAAARHLTPLTEALRAGHLESEDAVTIADYLFWHGRADEARAVLGVLGTDGGASGPRSVTDPYHPGHLQPWMHLSRPGTPKALPRDGRNGGIPGHVGLTASAALTSALIDGPGEKAIGWAEQVLADCTLSDCTVAAVQSALYALIHCDRAAKAAPWCHVFIAEARARQATTWEALFKGVRAEIALRQGDLPTAARWAEEALSLISPRCWGVAVGEPLAVLLLARTAMGRHEEAAQLLRHVVPDAMFETRFGLKYLHARGHHHLAVGRLQAALADFRRCGELMREWSLDLPALVPWRSDVARVQLALNQREAARELVTEELALPGATGARSRGVALRVLAAARDLKQRPLLLREAVDLLQAAGDRVELVRALAELSRAHHGLGEFNRARMMGRRAMQVAKDCGAEELCRQLLADQDVADGADGGEAHGGESAEALSDAERRVAALAAMGHTNREIGSRLYITVSTVEQHLTRVYRKLDVTRRTDLPLRLKDGDYSLPQQVAAERWPVGAEA
ncbi:helix-turn-helix transcriptional regulator [Streptomyces albireticuli]|uniref:LuxR family transcriptional regulator n=1 Tax=Streptomyces albireticuli TaxID=1940 RepID=A0A2A2D0W8_9ACTN|nr:AAA family ATPase [Streptomyces albireticuli]MCD9140476.1 AAA family ATPase [Streptomyces albireticuli]MCD9161562.1 AAA family ATPase [Streptomyces albireticuli]MCD9192868.1 AAA family ATPase [Streptomyces albireticuli]PAU46083.1 LuxR family transcriptional regulator [Streptomyces albireticuli]